MENISSEQSKGEITIDYVVDIPCPNPEPCPMCYIQFMDFAGKRVKKDLNEIVGDLQSLNEQGYSTYVITTDILNDSKGRKMLFSSKQKHVLTTGIPIVNDPNILRGFEGRIEQIILPVNLKKHAIRLGLPNQEIVKKATKISLSKGFPVMHTYIITRENYTQISKMLDNSHKMEVKTVRFLNYVPFSKDCGDSLNHEELKRFLEMSYEIQDSGRYHKKELYLSRENFPGPYHRKGDHCTAGEKRFLIGLDNFVYPCIFLVKPEFVIGRFKNRKIHLDSEFNLFNDNPFCKAVEYYSERD